MRIIAGKFKSRKFTAPKNLGTRPTTDFAKEGLFNVLRNRYYFEDLNVLDLFGGIGSISLEFISRGAQHVTSVEQNNTCVHFIENTAELLEIDNLEVIRDDVYKFSEKNNSGKKYDLIFADPPFQTEDEDYDILLSNILSPSWLKEEGIFILEHSKTKDFKHHPRFQEVKSYSNIKFSFFS